MKRYWAFYRTLLPLFGLLLAAGFCLSSCVTVATDQDIFSLNDQIVLLNREMNSLQDSLKRQEATLSKKLSGGVDTRLKSFRGNLAEVVAEIGNIRQDLNSLSGRVDENSHLAKHAIERDTTQEDMLRTSVADLKNRVGTLEKSVKDLKAYLGILTVSGQKPAKPEAVGTKPGNTSAVQGKQVSAEEAMYDKTLALYKAGNLEKAIINFKDFIKTYPKSDLADNAQFWIGECYMALKQYDQAILAYQQVITRYPKGNKVTNALLRQALAFQTIKDTTSAKLLLKKIIRNYPASNEAHIAKIKLKNIK